MTQVLMVGHPAIGRRRRSVDTRMRVPSVFIFLIIALSFKQENECHERKRQLARTSNNNGLPPDNQFMLAILSNRLAKNRSIIYVEGFRTFSVVLPTFFFKGGKKRIKIWTQKQKKEETTIKWRKNKIFWTKKKVAHALRSIHYNIFITNPKGSPESGSLAPLIRRYLTAPFIKI